VEGLAVVCGLLAEALGCDPMQVLPEDRFTVELALFEGSSLNDDEDEELAGFSGRVERLFVVQPPAWREGVLTVRDVAEMVGGVAGER
jgi:hypothetical protein